MLFVCKLQQTNNEKIYQKIFFGMPAIIPKSVPMPK
jgi:hypothetical protein